MIDEKKMNKPSVVVEPEEIVAEAKLLVAKRWPDLADDFSDDLLLVYCSAYYGQATVREVIDQTVAHVELRIASRPWSGDERAQVSPLADDPAGLRRFRMLQLARNARVRAAHDREQKRLSEEMNRKPTPEEIEAAR